MPDSIYDKIFEERNGKPITRRDVCGENSENCESLNRKENVIGIQGQLWSETVRTVENVDYMIFPQMIALAERAWHKAEFGEESISDHEREERFSPVMENGKVEVSTTFPGLCVQYSNNNGKSWSGVPNGQNIQWWGDTSLHLRTLYVIMVYVL
ncbi:beta-hexosaminidase-like [Mercenaria mercenaria]|uniref:beta-hexosaminidase-like n=1 Tax=Mercenaria mercenaria TaxID=6596 RepID=UPI00234E5DEB|nr:beta-hexosaminidase-like [Mercenaria mercenaria]